MVSALCAIALRTALPGDRLTVDVFDVGQGDAILVQCGSRQLLIDGGPDATVLSKLGRAMPFFDRRIDAVLLTHPHADHYLGLIPVFSRYRVDLLLTAGKDGEAAEYGAFLGAARAAGLETTAVRAGDRLMLGSCARGEVLWPPPSGVRTDDPNDASVVLRIERVDGAGPRAAVLLMGDATADVESALVAGRARLGADVLKVGHHGSRFSTSAAFVDAVRPDAAVVSVGKNRYGHPAAAALMRLASRGVRVMRTDREGDVRVVVGRDRAAAEGY